MKRLFWYQCSKLDFHSCPRPCDVEIPTLDASYPGGTPCLLMNLTDARLPRTFFNTNLELLQSVNYMPTSLLEIFMVAIFRSSSRVCDGWLLCGYLESVGTSWEWSWDIFWDLAWLPTVFAMVDGWSSLDYFMNISNKLMLLFWTFESSEDVIFIIICDLWHVYLVESTQ